MGHSTASGRRNEPARPATVERVEANEALAPTTGMRITKVAEQGFESAYQQARRWFREHPDDEDNLSIKPDFGERGYVSMQTLRGVQAKINSAQRTLDMDVRLGVGSEEKNRQLRKALNAVQRGLNSSYRQHRDFWDGNF